MKRTLILLAAATLALAPALARAAYPEKPIEVIVSWPAGIEADISARALSSALAQRLGVPVQVINKPGAQGVIGTAEVARAKPDGYTLGSLNIAAVVAQPIAGNAPYKPGDFEPIALYSAVTMVLAARADGPFRDMKTLEQHAKAGGKPPVFASYGPAAYPTLTLQRMAKQNGWSYKAVTFPSPSFVQLEAGDADFISAPYSVVAGAFKSKQAVPLAAMTKDRIAGLPDTPTIRELGYDFDSLLWSGLFAPKGTSPEIIERLAAAVRDAVKDRSMTELSQKINSPFFYIGPKEAAAQIQSDETALRPIMDSLGLIKR